MKSFTYILALRSFARAGELVLFGGTSCAAGCGSSSKIIVASDATAPCTLISGGNGLSVESITNIAPGCTVQFYGDTRCRDPEFAIDTTKRTPCQGASVIGSMLWTCLSALSEAGGEHAAAADSISTENGFDDGNQTSTGLLLSPDDGPSLFTPFLARRQCNHGGLIENMLFYAPRVPGPDGFPTGDTNMLIRDIDVGGGGGFPAGTINADAREVSQAVWTRAFASRENSLGFEMETTSGLRFEISVLAIEGDVRGRVGQMGRAALAAIFAASFFHMVQTGQQLLFFGIYERNRDGSTELMARISIDLLDIGNP